MRKLIFILLLLICLPLFFLTGQERYTKNEVDLKIEMEKIQIQKDMELFQKEIDYFRRELAQQKSDYEYRANQQDDKIANRNDYISIILTCLSIFLVFAIAFTGVFSYRKIKTIVEKELNEIKQIKGEIETHLDEIKNLKKVAVEETEEIIKQNKTAKEMIASLQGIPPKEQTPETIQNVAAFVETIATKPEDELTDDEWFIKGYNADLQNDYLEAERCYKKAIEKGDVSAMYNLGLLYQNQEKYELAEKYYLMAIEKEHVSAMYNYACLHSLLHKKEEALEWLEKYLKNPNLSRDYIENDADFNSIKEDLRFRALLDKYLPEK
jgi:tetratricopeptide (TPR) repeat protein